MKYNVSFDSKSPEEIARVLSLVHLFLALDDDDLDGIDLNILSFAIEWQFEKFIDYCRLCTQTGISETWTALEADRFRDSCTSSLSSAIDILKTRTKKMGA